MSRLKLACLTVFAVVLIAVAFTGGTVARTAPGSVGVFAPAHHRIAECSLSSAHRTSACSRVAQNCASDGSPCSDPNNSNPSWPVCSRDCCSGQYHDCDGIACICGPRPSVR